MTIEVQRSGEESQIWQDSAELNFSQWERILEYPRRTVRRAARRAGVLKVWDTGVADFYSLAGDIPKIVEQLLLDCRSPLTHARGIDASEDFSLKTPSGATVIYRYPQK